MAGAPQGTPATTRASAKSPDPDSSCKPHVAVIGAGISGLRCADVLLQHGFEVTLVEARSRIGGRLWQRQLSNGFMVDIGPNWIHGCSENPILDHAKAAKAVAQCWHTVTRVFDESGKLLSAQESDELTDLLWSCVEDGFRLSRSSGAVIQNCESLSDFLSTRAVELFPSSAPHHDDKRRLLLQISEAWGAYVGSPVSQQSLKFLWLEECIEGENLFCADTYKSILDVISKPALAGAHLILGAKAEKVIGRSHGRSGKVGVQVADGRLLYFDDVVVTVPLGWLKRNLDAFEPPLPDRFVGAIQAISYGSLEKVYINFPKPFWLSEDDKESGSSAHGFMYQWLSPTYAPDTNPKRWNQEAFEMASLAPGTAHPTLLFYIFGEQSCYFAAKMTKLNNPALIDDFLVDFFKPYYSRLPGYAEDSADCRPTECLATNWLCDEFAGFGSYSNFQVGLEAGDADIEIMREGLPDRGIWFAGEHTAPFLGLGTTTGAYWSGEAVGQRIAEAHGQAPGAS